MKRLYLWAAMSLHPLSDAACSVCIDYMVPTILDGSSTIILPCLPCHHHCIKES